MIAPRRLAAKSSLATSRAPPVDRESVTGIAGASSYSVSRSPLERSLPQFTARRPAAIRDIAAKLRIDPDRTLRLDARLLAGGGARAIEPLTA
jgi:hypothetical protein